MRRMTVRFGSADGYCSHLMERPNENLLSRVDQRLRQLFATRISMAAKLIAFEPYCDVVRAELAEMDTLASQTEAAIYRLLSSVLASSSLASLPSDAELEAAMRPTPGARTSYAHEVRRHEIPSLRPNTEAVSERFLDRTI